jgi:hypothetical protein
VSGTVGLHWIPIFGSPWYVISYLSPEQRVRKDHPLRAIRTMVDAAFEGKAMGLKQRDIVVPAKG